MNTTNPWARPTPVYDQPCPAHINIGEGTLSGLCEGYLHHQHDPGPTDKLHYVTFNGFTVTWDDRDADSTYSVAPTHSAEQTARQHQP